MKTLFSYGAHQACGAGCCVVHGIELFVWQALIQARYFVGSQLPGDAPVIVPQESERSGAVVGDGSCLDVRAPAAQRLLEKWKRTAEGHGSRPLNFSREEIVHILRAVRKFYRKEVDLEHIVYLREEDFFN